MTNYLHKHDLPDDVTFDGDLAVDTEAMGLNNKRDRLCVVQISDGNGDAHLVQLFHGKYEAPNLRKLLSDETRTKLFHFARFDVAIIKEYLQVDITPVYCTKIASRLTRTYTERHGFKDLCRELIGVEVSKMQQSSDWGADELSEAQVNYAADDVLYLHQLRDVLNPRLEREGRAGLAAKLCAAIPARAEADLAGWADIDIFAH